MDFKIYWPYKNLGQIPSELDQKKVSSVFWVFSPFLMVEFGLNKKKPIQQISEIENISYIIKNSFIIINNKIMITKKGSSYIINRWFIIKNNDNGHFKK